MMFLGDYFSFWNVLCPTDSTSAGINLGQVKTQGISAVPEEKSFTCCWTMWITARVNRMT
jgi:hypothetical protein